METAQLKKFAQYARRNLIEFVSNRLEQVLADDSPARRESAKAISDLGDAINASNKEQVIEKTAYIWFNRFCALRFMDVNRYNRIGVISPVDGQIQPEILAEAKAGLIDETSVDATTREKVTGLLNGTTTSRDPQTEAYRLLIVAVCNDYHRIMPYLFERIADYTELLMPDDLLSENSILEHTRKAMTPEACESVESIGWLYQFYISEKKDDVFAGLKKNIKVTPENIPAATQLFTPHWIVRYLVENSLGRLWMLNNPDSKIIEQMEYLIAPSPSTGEGWDEGVNVWQQAQNEQDYLKIQSPEELKICDPACGSGHMLTYAYDLLYAIYLDKGYDSTEIPEKILTHNLYGIEIDERAAELAAFALTMKAMKGNPLDDSNNRRRFFRNPIKPNICRLENVRFSDDALDEYINFAGRDLFTQDLRATLKQFEEADNFGSLIQPELKNVNDVREVLKAKDVSSELFLAQTHKGVLKILDQADYLSSKYHIVIANPPYMGGKGMNGRLGKWLKDNFQDSKSDLFAAFIERGVNMVERYGYSAMITMQSWMFLSSYEQLRKKLLRWHGIDSLLQIGYNSFPELNSKVAQAVAFVLRNSSTASIGYYFNLNDAPQLADKNKVFLEKLGDSESHFRVRSDDFSKIPGSPIAYWSSKNFQNLFTRKMLLSDYEIFTATGLQTGDNNRFIRFWFEHSYGTNESKWIPLNNGGEERKWYGNFLSTINWGNSGEEIKKHKSSVVRNSKYYFEKGATWNRISSTSFSIRYLPQGFIFDQAGDALFTKNENKLYLLIGFLNSSIGSEIMKIICPTLNATAGNINNFPYPMVDDSASKTIVNNTKELIELTKNDWDSNEYSSGFLELPMLQFRKQESSLGHTYKILRDAASNVIFKIKDLEEENNNLFINALGLLGEIDSSVSLNNITFGFNPSFRYRGVKLNEDIDVLLIADTMKEFISYAVGCMFGRYSFDKEGLILANQGETLEDYLKQIPQPQFEPDDDNVIPLIDLELERGKQDDWFEDDISERFKVFLKVTFGTENYDENLRFIEEAIGKNIKKFFLKDFYTDHIKRYKKRPIYWLFSSPKGSFNALIYMHRYRADTVSVVLNDYLREFATKLTARKESYEQTAISISASTSDKAKALKAVDKINKVQQEIKDYERDILYPLAGQNIEIDLDDGVKHNYPLFGQALKKVTGLS